jgi:hypothetical protein
MARFLLLLLLPLSLLRTNDVQAACYASQWSNGAPVYGSLFVDGGTTIAQCQAIACQIYPWISPSCPQACQPETQVQSLSCPANQSGSITQTKTKACPSNVWGDWLTISNTCVPNPPTCQTSVDQKTESCGLNFSGQKTYTKQNSCPNPYGSPVQGQWVLTSNTCVQDPPSCKTTTETQTLSCQTGFTGSITQTRSSTCPNPYGTPVYGPWVTTSDACKKSMSNPTNPMSPVSPLNPAMQTPTPTAAAPTPTTPPSSNAPTQESSAPESTAPTGAKVIPPPKGKVRSVVGLALSVELFVKPGLQQANVFPEVSIVQGIPNDILMQDTIMMGLLQQPGFNQPAYNQDLGFEQ